MRLSISTHRNTDRRMASMTHPAHKKGAVGLHREWDVSKDPFSPPWVIELELKKHRRKNHVNRPHTRRGSS